MKLLPLCTIFLTLPCVGLWSETFDVNSTVDSVTIYQLGAKVTRTFEVNLKPGENDVLRFAGLPSETDGALVQVGTTEGAKLDFGVASLTSVYEAKDHSQTLKDLEAKVRGIEARIAEIEADRKAADDFVLSRKSLVDSINDGLAKTGKLELYELSKSAYSDEEQVTHEAVGKIAKLDEALRVEGENLAAAKLAVEKQRQREASTAAKYSVAVVSSGGATKGQISYYVPLAFWSPAYVVKADTAAGNADISYLCAVTQSSGEDWNNVTLYLETSKPSAGAKPIDPNVIVLWKREPIMALAAGAPPPQKDVALEANTMRIEKSARMGKAVPAGAMHAVTASLTGFRAAISGRVSVPSSGDTVILPLVAKSMSCEFHTETVPATAETAFLVGKLKNAFDLPLLAGEMQVIVDGSTNGTGTVEETLPGAEMTLGFGVNQNVVVERKKIADKGGQGGIFGGKRVETRSYVNKLTNHMKVPARVVVRETVPLSKDDKIVVELLQPKGAKIDPEKGSFEREVTLQPGASVELPTEFTVTCPSDWQIRPAF
jgi:uncharacterized protein (TIGR02231 family)